MDLLSKISKNDESGPTSGDPNNSDQLKPSKSDLIHSAKVVADAAKAHVRHEPDKYDKAQVAGAAADLMNAAAEYSKLDDKGVGKYVDKAEDCLRKYSSDHAGKPGDNKPAKAEGGGADDFMKMAGDFLKK